MTNKENVINCKRLHRENMVFATISNDCNYICIITFYENNYNVELFNANNKMQKIFRKEIPDTINKVYINYNNKYICVTSQNGSIYILNMKGVFLYKNEILHCLFRKKYIKQKPISINSHFNYYYSKRKRKKILRSTVNSQKKDNEVYENKQKKIKYNKLSRKNSVTFSLNNNKNNQQNDKIFTENNIIINDDKNSLSENLQELYNNNNYFFQKDQEKQNFSLKSKTYINKSEKNEGYTNLHFEKKKEDNYYERNVDNNINKFYGMENIKNKKEHEDVNEIIYLDEYLNEKSNTLEKYKDSKKINFNNYVCTEDCKKDKLLTNEDFIFEEPEYFHNELGIDSQNEIKNSDEEYKRIGIEIVDIYWICMEKENKKDLIEIDNCIYSYDNLNKSNFYDNLHIIYSLDAAFNIICSINLKIIIYKYNILNYFYKNISPNNQFKNNIVYLFKKKFLQKCKEEKKYTFIKYLKSKLDIYNNNSCIESDHNKIMNKRKIQDNLNTSINRYKNLTQLYRPSYINRIGQYSSYYLDVKENIIKKIFNDMIIEMNQSYISSNQNYILINYYINIKKKYLKFSSLNIGMLIRKKKNPAKKIINKKEDNKEKKINVKRSRESFSSCGSKNYDEQNDNSMMIDLVKIYMNKNKLAKFPTYKHKLGVLGIQKINTIDREYKSIEHFALYLLYCFDIFQNIFNIYKRMSYIYSRCDEYKKLYTIYEYILSLNENYKKYYYKDRSIIYFSKYIKNRKEYFDENLYKMFFKKSEKQDFDQFYYLIKKMINENTVCCSCSKKKYLEKKKYEQSEIKSIETSQYFKTKPNIKINFNNYQNKDNNINISRPIKNYSSYTQSFISKMNKGQDKIHENIKNIIKINKENRYTNSFANISKYIDEKNVQNNCNKKTCLSNGIMKRYSEQKNINSARAETKNNITIKNKNEIKRNVSKPILEIKEKNDQVKKNTNWVRNGKVERASNIPPRGGEDVYIDADTDTDADAATDADADVGRDNRFALNKINKNEKQTTNTVLALNPVDDISSCCFSSGNSTIYESDKSSEEDQSDEIYSSVSEQELEKCFLKNRKFIIKDDKTICEDCENILKNNILLHTFEKFELNYEIPKKKKKIAQKKIYSSLIKDIYTMYREKKCPINILLLLQEINDKELENNLIHLQYILHFFEKTFLQNISDYLNNLFKIINVCKGLVTQYNCHCKKEMNKLYNAALYCRKKFESFYKLKTPLNIYYLVIELLVFISKNIYFENFPHYKKTFSNYRYVDLLNSYNIFKNNKMNFSCLDKYLHINSIKAHKFYIALNQLRISLINILRSFSNNNNNNNNFSILYNLSILNVPPNKFHFITLPKNKEKYHSCNNYSYFDDILYNNQNKLYPFYICTCDTYSFISIKKYIQTNKTFMLIQREFININLYPLRLLNIIVISKNMFYIFTEKDKKLNITSIKVKYDGSQKKILNNGEDMREISNLSVLNCSSLETYFPNADSYNIKIQILYNSIIANFQPHMCLILQGF
ncbi:conserved Plasmodium protein, unknown function [Plasmodium yoelii]|nr:conserved Plasmodium protein, unknown function [Plasmodium yoelii]CDU17488.1 conserved Plasmodium protein, unknown function [Plasmodium yoelii]VTZ77252.1 conserved Plasmodium protein, unknown function [Plasmodium yoelii]|eukprot:XP_022811926.1 conserved Plasmodium protein, unknown function [Plasmodium yoelii]